MTPDQRAAQVARSQYGLLSSRDAAAAGLSPTQVDYRVDATGWVRRTRGLYVLPGALRSSWRQDAMAGVLLGGTGARASHITSSALHCLCSPSLLPHVTVGRGRSARTRLAVIHRSDVPAIDRAVVDGIPCTAASRALVESASVLDRATLEELVDQAICLDRATAATISASLDRAGPTWPGRALLTSVLKTWTDDLAPDSPAEARFLRRLLDWGATGVVTQHEVRDHLGGFVARVDAAIPELMQAFEYDSDRFHNPRRYAADERRHDRLVALGWAVAHVSKRDLLPSNTRIPELLAARRAVRFSDGVCRSR